VKNIMNKDQTIGGAILLVCVVVAIGYLITLFYPDWLVNIGLLGSSVNVQFWVIATPVFVAFVAILGIGAWIGYTMATTPPPKPIEEITTTEPSENQAPQENKP
jgi:predicted DNA-binding transcriptional regulator